MENDLLTDYFYTSATRIEYNDDRLPSLVGTIYEKVLSPLHKNSISNKLNGYGLGQKFYTPGYRTDSDITYGDRPYAGVLYFSDMNHLNWGNHLLSSEIQIGTIGSHSGSRETQDYIHGRFGYLKSRGWDHQAEKPLAFNHNVQHYYLFNKYFAWNTGFSAGTMENSMNTGPLIRIGRIASKDTVIGTSVLKPGPPPLFTANDDPEDEDYIYINPNLKAVEYDATLGDSTGKNYNPNKNLPEEIRFKKDAAAELVRFLYFENYWRDEGSKNNPLKEYLLFNTIFNNSRGTNSGENSRIAMDLLYLNNLGRNNEVAALLFYSNYERYSENAENKWNFVKWLAYDIVLREKFKTDRNSYMLAMYYLFHNDEFNSSKKYSVKPRLFQSQINIGFISTFGMYFFNTNVTLSNTDFVPAKGIPGFHMWFSMQFGVKF